MPKEIFSIAGHSLRVFQDPDGPVRWMGKYRDVAVAVAHPIEHGARCILLLEMTVGAGPSLENLICVRRDGTVDWRAEPPCRNDAFVSLSHGLSGLLATSWSGYRVRLDTVTGRCISRKFVK